MLFLSGDKLVADRNKIQRQRRRNRALVAIARANQKMSVRLAAVILSDSVPGKYPSDCPPTAYIGRKTTMRRCSPLPATGALVQLGANSSFERGSIRHPRNVLAADNVDNFLSALKKRLEKKDNEV